MSEASPIAIAAAAPKTLVRPETCAKCKWSTLTPGNMRQRECRRNPPHITHFPQVGPNGRLMGHASISGWPIVQDAQWCGQFVPRVEGLS